MANIKSQIKRVKTAKKANEINTAKKTEMRTAIKKAKLAKAENAENVTELVSFAVKLIDKAKKSNLIHSNTADRYKSRLMSK